MNQEVHAANLSLFSVVRQAAAEAIKLKKEDEQTESSMGKIKTLIEAGDVPFPGIRYAFEKEVSIDLADSLWTTLKQKSENPLAFVSVIKTCKLTERFDCGFIREATKAGSDGKEFYVSEIVLTDEKRLTVLFIETTEGRNFLVTNEVVRHEGKCYLKGVYVYDWAKPQADFDAEMEDMSAKIIAKAQQILKAQ